MFHCKLQKNFGNPWFQAFSGIFTPEKAFIFCIKDNALIDRLLADNSALFARGELSQDQKDVFFQAVMTAYVTCREETKEKFGRKLN